MSVFTNILLTLILILVNGFFVTSEFALLRVRNTRLQRLYAKNAWGSNSLKKIMQNLNLYIISAQIGITMTTIIIGFVTIPYFTSLLGSTFLSAEIPVLNVISFVISLLIVSYLYSVIGELSPKIIAIQQIETIALAIAPIMYWFTLIISPITILFRKSSIGLLKLLRFETVDEVYTRVYTEDELKIIIAQSQQMGEIDKSEEFLINRILDFTDTRVNEIFTPRFQIVAFDLDTPIEEIVEKSNETGYSRFPVYEGTLDNVKGFIHVKDVINPNIANQNFNLEMVMRPVITIHEAMRLDFILKKMQHNRSQVAIAIDEYGSVEGLVTIEDILEAIVGPIDDEFDVDSVELIKKIGKTKYVVDGRVTLDVFNQTFQCNLTAQDSLTLAGFLLESLESVPKEGSKLHYSGKKMYFEFTVKKMDGNRVDKAQVMIRIKSDKELQKEALLNEKEFKHADNGN